MLTHYALTAFLTKSTIEIKQYVYTLLGFFSK